MTPLDLYGIPNCNSVKKARDYLNQHAINYVFHDFKKIELCETLLAHWLIQIGHEKLINRNGSTWRGLEEATKLSLHDSKSVIELMQNKPSIIKRPVLEKDGKIISVGFDVAHYAQICKA